MEWLIKSAQFVQDDTQGPNITLRRLWLTATRLWRHVVRRSDDRHSCRGRRLKNLTDTEVANLDRVTASQEDILSLDVAVDDLTPVNVLQSHANLDHPMEDLLLGKRLIFRLFALDVVGYIAHLAVLHDDGEGVRGEEALLVLNDVRVDKVFE